MVLAKRYAHLLFERYQYKINFLIEPERFKIKGYNFQENLNILGLEMVTKIEDKSDFLNEH